MQNYAVLYSEQFRCKIRETAKGCPMRILRKTVFLLLILPWLANAQSNLSVLSLNNIQFADQQTGTDACAKIRSAAALFSSSPSVGMFLANPFVIFRNHSSFSQLGGQNDGTLTYCADCTVATPSSCSTANPSACVCASGGTGAFAKRVNGAWFCN
jgi:hypothetical protein